MDHLTKEKRSWNMSHIRSEGTEPEIIFRKLIHRAGFRYRLYDKTLPGKPDLVLKKHCVVVFIHGCFWHGHENCQRGKSRKPIKNTGTQKLLEMLREMKKTEKNDYCVKQNGRWTETRKLRFAEPYRLRICPNLTRIFSAFMVLIRKWFFTGTALASELHQRKML
jgi:DNA mismatch endonuclease (patch repair protein)